MEIRVHQGALTDADATVLVVATFEGEPLRDPSLNEATGGQVEELYLMGEFAGKSGETGTIYRPSGLKARRLLLVGAGKAATFNPGELRKLVGTAVRIVRSRTIHDLALLLPAEFAEPQFIQAAVEGAITGEFEPDQLKSDPKRHEKRIDSFTVFVPQAESSLEKAADVGRIVGESQNFARDLVNLPANLLTPMVLAEKARTMASEVGLECEVLETEQMQKLGMGSLLGVAQGSDNPPALIVLRYTPSRAVSGDHLALVGKGVTFDTGGISIKPSEGMEKMKYDMGGAASVLGAMRAIAQLKPDVRISAYVPTVENMVSGRAQRPGDIVTAMNGKTIEVLNTDAEGRLILADALTYAIRNGGATHLIDAATLTGAIAVALGHLYFGAFTNNDELYDRLLAASCKAGERMWRLPMDDDYKEYLKSAFADIPNIGGRWGGSITAAKFLEEFVEAKPWVHLDIAGTAWLDDGKPWLAKGPTGVPVRTFVNLALDWTPAS